MCFIVPEKNICEDKQNLKLVQIEFSLPKYIWSTSSVGWIWEETFKIVVSNILKVYNKIVIEHCLSSELLTKYFEYILFCQLNEEDVTSCPFHRRWNCGLGRISSYLKTCRQGFTSRLDDSRTLVYSHWNILLPSDFFPLKKLFLLLFPLEPNIYLFILCFFSERM